MEQRHVYVFVLGQLFAAQAELEAMKVQNEIDKALQRPLTYNPTSFFEKADEIRSITDHLFKY